MLNDFAWQKCMLDDGRLLELSEPTVWALVLALGTAHTSLEKIPYL